MPFFPLTPTPTLREHDQAQKQNTGTNQQHPPILFRAGLKGKQRRTRHLAGSPFLADTFFLPKESRAAYELCVLRQAFRVSTATGSFSEAFYSKAASAGYGRVASATTVLATRC